MRTILLLGLLAACASCAENNAEAEMAASAMTAKSAYCTTSCPTVPAKDFLRLGYTNNSLCPSVFKIRNTSDSYLITATIRYTFALHPWPGYPNGRRPAEYDTITVPPGAELTLDKYVRAGPNCPANALIAAKVTGAYYTN